MEKNQKDNVQTENIIMAAEPGHSAEAQKATGSAESSPFGKFKSADALLQAYNSLQSEFTRRSQRLKELENDAARNTVQSDAEPAPMSEENASAAPSQASMPDGRESDENALYERVKNSARVRQRIVDDYLSGVKNSAVPLLSGGMSVTTPPMRAKTVEEAGNFALGYFRTRK